MTMTMTATTVTSATTARTATGRWTHVCDLDRLEADRGVTALVDGRHVAVFRLSGTDELLAIDNVDPFTGASVLSRGIVGASRTKVPGCLMWPRRCASSGSRCVTGPVSTRPMSGWTSSRCR